MVLTNEGVDRDERYQTARDMRHYLRALAGELKSDTADRFSTGGTAPDPTMRRPSTPTSVARYLWALPNTLLGLLFLPAAARGGIAIVHGVVELHGPLVAAVLRRVVPIPGGAAAMTFGHVVIGRDQCALDITRVHERVHVRQYERWGPAFIPAYLTASAWAWLRGRRAYEGNYFEREAFGREGVGREEPLAW